MNKELNVKELFAGIGMPRISFNRANILARFEAIEFDKFATLSYSALHNDNVKPRSVVDYVTTEKDIDLLFHGSPCQDFSQGGHGKGGKEGSGTRSSLLWESVRIIKDVLPKVVIWENVKRAKSFSEFEDYLQTMNDLGYKTDYRVLNSLKFGVPQNRERLFVISTRTPIYNKRLETLFDDLETTTYKALGEFINFTPNNPKTISVDKCKRYKSYWTYPSKSGRINSGLCRASDYTMYSPTISTFTTREKIGWVDENNILHYQPLNVYEKGLLMGLTIEEVDKMLSVNHRRHVDKQLGNSIVANVLTEIFKKLFK